jgi:TRAP-type mannitol/chloroaromatic compound transport system permease small subunit
MYIEMTTFAIPTFLIDAVLVVLGMLAAYMVLASVVITIYNRSVERAIRKQMEIDAEIDRLHK